MSQEKYALDIEKRVGIETCKPIAAPLALCDKLSVSMGELFRIEDVLDIWARGTSPPVYLAHACLLGRRR
jgi:hypothetical protein